MTRLLGCLVLLLLVACERDEPRPDPPVAVPEKPAASAPALCAEEADAPPACSGEGERVAVSEPVDAQFTGCAASCGMHEPDAKQTAVPQPDAKIGDVSHCPVSGARFEITGSSPRRQHGEKQLFFCCEACAKYFSDNRDVVLRRRGMS